MNDRFILCPICDKVCNNSFFLPLGEYDFYYICSNTYKSTLVRILNYKMIFVCYDLKLSKKDTSDWATVLNKLSK